MTIGDAIEAIKDGRKVKRLNWNGKDQFIFLAKAVSVQLNNGSNSEVIPHMNIGNSVIVFSGTSGYQVGWLASQADLLSEDWVILDG